MVRLFLAPLLTLSLSEGKKTIIISSDGFRWDYYGRVKTPAIDKIRSNGVQVKNLINSFATVTFPNHYTLVTGLYEEHHGIVDNEMYDPDFNQFFDMSTTDSKWWQQAEPIWVTASKAGKKSVCVNWVGCAIPIHGEYPTYWNAFDESIEYNTRVHTVASKINDDADLGLLYFEEPDHSCHKYGPDSQEVLLAIKKVDDAIQLLLEQVDLNQVNVIFTADHGGYSVSQERVVLLEAFTQKPFNLVASGAVAHIWPQSAADSAPHEILEDLRRIKPEQATCYLKDDLPERLHYSKNRRIAPVVCIAILGWTILKSEADRDAFTLKGSHGYDPTLDEESPMRPIFIAGGPLFRQAPLSEPPAAPFESIHIYPLLIRLLEIHPEYVPRIDGSQESTDSIMRFGKVSKAVLQPKSFEISMA